MEHQRPDRLPHQRAEVRLQPRELARDNRLAAAALMLPASTMAENVVRSRGSRQGNGQSPAVRA